MEWSDFVGICNSFIPKGDLIPKINVLIENNS
uniref:Uncharacterized protein n=1 Tax=Arundo donax TaxID=35708 RepID=A0A0A9BVZ5_ARUDO